MNKAKAQRLHTARRSLERFGVWLTCEAQDSIIKMIQGGEADFVSKQSNRVTIWDVNFNGRRMRVCYDKSRQTIATVLTLDMGV